MSRPSSAAQRRYIASLAAGDPELFAELFNKAARLNQNRPLADHETPTQAAKRLTAKAASALIESLLTAKVEPQPIPDPHAKAKPRPFLDVHEPEKLEPVKAEVHDDLAH